MLRRESRLPWASLFVCSALLFSCGQDLADPCSGDAQCAGDPLTAANIIVVSPAAQTLTASEGEATSATVTLTNKDSTSHTPKIACTGLDATPSPAAPSLASGASASVEISLTAQSSTGTETATCTVDSSSGKTTWATFTISIKTGGGSAGGSGSGSAGGNGGGSAGGSAGGSGGGSGGGSAGGNGGGSAGGSGDSDGPPTRTAACTPLSQETGTAIDTSHGRLDGFVTFVLPKGGSSACNGDSGHIHIQVSANGAIYDVAVDIGSSPGDALLYETNMALPDGAWSEGWHNDALSYTSLGISSTQFTSQDPDTLATALEAELANVNHISVFGTAYSSHNGCHDIHYENGNDGALVLEPLSATPHVLFFRFSTQSF